MSEAPLSFEVDQRDLRKGDCDRPGPLLSAALVEKPDEQRREPVEERFRPRRQIGGFVMLDDQISAEVRQPHGEGCPIDMRDKHQSGIRPKLHVARSAAADGGTEFPLCDQTQALQRRQSVRDHGSPQFGFAFDVEARGRDAVPHEAQDLRETRAAAFKRRRPADASSRYRVIRSLLVFHLLCHVDSRCLTGNFHGGKVSHDRTNTAHIQPLTQIQIFFQQK